MADDLINEILVKLEPVLFGAGVPLVGGTMKQTKLDGTCASKPYRNAVVLRYRVTR